MFGKETLQDLNAAIAKASLEQELAHHRKHIQVLWNHIERLEAALNVRGGNELSLNMGTASLVMKKDGTVAIKGNTVTIDSMGRMSLKSATDLSLKGSRILNN